MEELKKKTKRKLAPSATQRISVFVYDKNLKEKAIKSIKIGEILDHFPSSMAGSIHKQHHIPFVTCLKAFLENYLGGKVEPIFEIQSITGVSHKEVRFIENLCTKKMKL
ncbi:MAG: hypothetical protein ABGX00_00790 [Allomuricauda sp.]|uniref:hypothetical protein n=1 Tax=Sinomicrobium oceani TaxID=1150368 RepID=UPI00227CE978|nr:hypothetical protein [Sinomicrobium oceani]|tara:strand:+ start:15434 stop:15760 length:327 start_codon:yes stop_codon:yes gene_type:complete